MTDLSSASSIYNLLSPIRIILWPCSYTEIDKQQFVFIFLLIGYLDYHTISYGISDCRLFFHLNEIAISAKTIHQHNIQSNSKITKLNQFKRICSKCSEHQPVLNSWFFFNANIYLCLYWLLYWQTLDKLNRSNQIKIWRCVRTALLFTFPYWTALTGNGNSETSINWLCRHR